MRAVQRSSRSWPLPAAFRALHAPDKWSRMRLWKGSAMSCTHPVHNPYMSPTSLGVGVQETDVSVASLDDKIRVQPDRSMHKSSQALTQSDFGARADLSRASRSRFSAPPLAHGPVPAH